MKIFGTVADNGGGLPGANITLIDDPSVWTISDANGEFELDSSKIKPASQIKISFVGYSEKVLPASEITGKSFYMQESTEELPELILYTSPKEKPLPVYEPKKENKFMDHLKKYKMPYSIAGSVVLIIASALIIRKANQ